MDIQTATIAALLLALQGCAILRGPPELPDAQKPARKVAIRLHAGPNLNAGTGRQPYAVAARIYKLRHQAAFERMPFDAFLNAHAERDALGSDLLDATEVMLIPGQRYETTEKVTREAYFIGVVALFRSPAEGRWRMVVPAAEAEKHGLTISLHACAISTGASPTPVRCE